MLAVSFDGEQTRHRYPSRMRRRLVLAFPVISLIGKVTSQLRDNVGCSTGSQRRMYCIELARFASVHHSLFRGADFKLLHNDL